MKPHEKTRFDALLAWSQQHGGELHPALEIYCDDVTKFSLRVKPSAADGLQPGFRAVSCPVSTTLSYLNALVDGPLDIDIASPGSPSPSPQAHNAAFPPRFLQSNPPHVVGRFFLVKEYLRGKASFWWPYIATLPQPEHVDAWALPAFWPDHDIACLAGTNAHVAVEEMQANVRREFKHARRLLKDDNVPGWQDYTQLLYKWSFSIFTSRSFRPSLILSAASQHHAATLFPPTSQVHLDDFSILQPLLDIANHSPTARYAWSTTHPPTACTLVPHDPYPPGAQVYNHYGAKTNSELLLAYGFLLPPSATFHNDYVHVRKRNHPPQQQPNTTNPDSSSSSPKEEDDENEEKKPKDFLLSLRPLAHASSLVGRARLALNPAAATRLARLPCFVCVEPALVEDLAGAVVASREEAEAVERWNCEGDEGLGGVEGEGLLPEVVAGVVERVRAVLGGKVEGDLERLRAAAEGLDLDGEGGGRNRELARRYREGCERVLEAALEGLMVDVGGQGGEE